MSDPAQNPSTSPDKGKVPPAVANMQAGIDKATATMRALPKPLKILIITTLAAAVAIGAYFGVAPMLQDYQALWTDLDPTDASAMVQVLDEKHIPYRLANGGTTIEVPADRVDATRLALAGEGRLPSGGKFGLDQLTETPIGTSEAMQKVLRQRAIEGELSRTIETIEAVKAARLHLVLHERSIFVQKVTPSRASITLELRPGARLSQEQVQGVVNLVASAVPRLEPSQVSIVTTDGEILHRPIREGDDIGGADALSQKMKYEREAENDVLSLLEGILGPGRAHVRVSAVIETAKIEEKIDDYGDHVIETHRKTTEGGSGGAIQDATPDGGTPGAESNIPTGSDVPPEGAAAPAEVPMATGAGRTDESKGYVVDHHQKRRVGIEHDVKRLTVAVALDEVETVVDGEVQQAPLAPEDVEKIRALVADTVGLDEARGDDLQVASMPFHRPELPEAAPEPVLLPIPDAYKKWVPLASRAGLGLLGLIALLVIRRKLKKRSAKKDEEDREVHEGELLAAGTAGGSAAAAIAANTKAAELDGEAASEAGASLGAASPSDVDRLLQEAQRLDAAKIDRETKLETLRQIALERATGDAATAALVIRHWLGTAQADEREEAA